MKILFNIILCVALIVSSLTLKADEHSSSRVKYRKKRRFKEAELSAEDQKIIRLEKQLPNYGIFRETSKGYVNLYTNRLYTFEELEEKERETKEKKIRHSIYI
jgi:hypothetical protein